MPCVSSPMTSPVMLADRTPSVRLMETGPSLTTGSARSPRRAEPVGPKMVRDSDRVDASHGPGVPDQDHVDRLSVDGHGRDGLTDEVLTELEADLPRGEPNAGGRLRIDLYGDFVAGLRDAALEIGYAVNRRQGGNQLRGHGGYIVVVGAGDEDLHAAGWGPVLDLSDAQRASGLVELVSEYVGDVVRGIRGEVCEEGRLPGAARRGAEGEIGRADADRVHVGHIA